MNIVQDIFVNLIAAFIGFLLGLAWQRIYGKIKIQRLKHFWRPLLHDKLYLVVGRHRQFDLYEPSGFLGVGSAVGYAELHSHFERLGFRDIELTYADRIAGDSLKENLILIGGPLANEISKLVIPKLAMTLVFGNLKDYTPDGVSILDLQNQKNYVPTEETQSRDDNKDYGLIVRAPNPFSPGKQILMIAGSFGYGTWAGVRLAKSTQFAANEVVSSGKAFECLLEVDVVRRTPQDIRIVEIRELKT